MKYVILALSLLCGALTVHAGPYEYQCVVQQVAEVDAAGKLKTTKPSSQLSFSVSRKSGAIIGAPFSNTVSISATNIQVLDYGSKDQAFKVLSVYKGAFTSVDYLVVEEFADGQDKPFRGMAMSSIYTGTCK